MPFTLTGFDCKVAVVTGAGRMRSIGRPIALALAQAGCDVVLTGTGRAPQTYPQDEQDAGWRDIESVADEIHALGRRALPVVTGVADPEAVDALVARVVAEFGRVDFLVNNAGAARGGDRVPVTELSLDTWKRVMDTNLNGTFYMSRAFAQHMSAQGEGGAIVNISSLAARLLAPDTAAYATTKIVIARAEFSRHQAALAERDAAREQGLGLAKAQLQDQATQIGQLQEQLRGRNDELSDTRGSLARLVQERDAERRRHDDQLRTTADENRRAVERTAANERHLLGEVDRARAEAKESRAALAAAERREAAQRAAAQQEIAALGQRGRMGRSSRRHHCESAWLRPDSMPASCCGSSRSRRHSWRH